MRISSLNSHNICYLSPPHPLSCLHARKLNTQNNHHFTIDRQRELSHKLPHFHSNLTEIIVIWCGKWFITILFAELLFILNSILEQFNLIVFTCVYENRKRNSWWFDTCHTNRALRHNLCSYSWHHRGISKNLKLNKF